MLRKNEYSKRKFQHRKPFHMNNELFEKWKRYEGQQLINGRKITFQGVVENLLENFLKNQ